MNYVNLIDSELTDEYASLNISTSELSDFCQPFKLKYKFKGVEYFFSVRNYKINGVVDKYLTMIINSKMLRESYFEGLTISNIRIIYEDILSFKLFKISFYDFLNRSFATDVDFFLDYFQEDSKYHKDIEAFKQLTPYTQKRDRGYKLYDGGIEWNERDSSTYANPFVKIYHKELELWSENNRFSEAYLVDSDITDRKRFEVNVKGKNELKKCGITKSSLAWVLSSSQQLRYKLMANSMGRVLDSSKISDGCLESRNWVELSNADTVLKNMIRALYINGMEWEEIFSISTNGLESKRKSDYKKKLLPLYNIVASSNLAIPYILIQLRDCF